MKVKFCFLAAALLTAAACGSHALAQANVNENEPVTIYVNGSTGSNSNPGTSSSKPVKTIQQGVNDAIVQVKRSVGAKVLIAPGVYRETVTVPSFKTGAALTIQAQTQGTVYIDGTNVLTSGSPGSAGVYNYPWTDTVTGCSLPAGWYTGMPPVVLANEMVWVNGTQMTQVMSASQLRAGTFYVNSSNREVEISPPAGTNMNSATVEVSARRATLNASGVKNFVVRGIVMQRAAACINQTGATVGSSSNVLFANDQANWNNWSGLGINGSTNVTVENTFASYNGGAGLSGFEDVNTLFQNNETDYNNWRGSMVGLYDFAQSGVKFGHARTLTVSGQQSYNNGGQGLWFDTDNANITISGSKLVGNLVGNLQLEANQGPFTVENNYFCSGDGVQIIDSEGIAMTGNVFYNNGGQSFQNGQLFLAGNPGGRTFTDFQTGKEMTTTASNMSLHDNSFIASGPNQYVFNTYLSGSDWSGFVDTLKSNTNHWYNASNSTDFSITAGKRVNLAGWQGASKQDTDSVWALMSSSAPACSAPTPSSPDFQLQAHNSASYVSGYAMSGGKLSIPLQVKTFNIGAVQLSVSGLPSGVSAAFSSSSLSTGSSTLTLASSKSVSSERVPVTIFGVSGSRVHTITLWVTVGPS